MKLEIQLPLPIRQHSATFSLPLQVIKKLINRASHMYGGNFTMGVCDSTYATEVFEHFGEGAATAVTVAKDEEGG